ncbi:wax ester/triacylglycerol synthase family O-acyltransferase [Stigmatella sp. ncwal1]|uniref:diacylglycerol O-acyltransferase n=1 Tax=Stigmatella ashevillensis TaxID=2995309 RepID=A0ABT5DIK7_9BACT|nr:wax ester/triacylglycerol synthase family O-acyltransferase [Stigmatella ashevillena]MDC0713468.1 wax ester/triacylglycerol synthase family O-acyltransferase [Stigmatella ashevillena]
MERMSSVDAAWLRMETPTNLMMITAVLWFDTPLDWARLKQVVRERLVERFPRFRQKVADASGEWASLHWQEAPDFELEAHLGHLTLDAPGDRAALEALVSQWMSTPLDRSRPLWQLHGLDGFGQGSALLVRIHHSLADGISLARVLLSLMDERSEGQFVPESEAARSGAVPAWMKLLRGARAVVTGSRAALKRGAELISEPIQVGDLVRAGARGVSALGRLTVMTSEPLTVLRGELGTQKRATWSAPIALEEVRALSEATGSTVNDVLLAALTGALRRYLVARGGPVEDLRVLVPVNLRPLDEPLPRELGNRFGVVFLELPVRREEPHRRLQELKRRMEVLKRSPEAVVTFGALSVLGMAPSTVERRAMDVVTRRATLIMTNVPGPRHPVFLAGTQLSGLMFWVPQAGKLGLGVSIFSYAGQVTVGVSVDAALVPDPHRMVEAFHDELRALGREDVSPAVR